MSPRLFRCVNTLSQKAGVLVGFTDPTSSGSSGCMTAIVLKEPARTRGNEVNALEWKIDCPCWQHETVRVAQGVAG